MRGPTILRSMRSRATAALVATVALGLVSAAEPREEPVLAAGIPLGVSWKLVECWVDGKPDRDALGGIYVFSKDTFHILRFGSVYISPWKSQPRMDPPGIDSLNQRGIYRLDGDTLTLCLRNGPRRPADFTTSRGDNKSLLVLRRIKQ